MTINRELCEEIALRLIERPEQYDQSSWYEDHGHPIEKFQEGVCNSTACVAGTAVILTDLKEARRLAPMQEDDLWMEAGAEALGLSFHQAGWLFDGSRIEDRMPYILKDLANGRPFWEVVSQYGNDAGGYSEGWLREFYADDEES